MTQGNSYNSLIASYPPLFRMMDQYSGEKIEKGTDKNTTHSYGPIYEKIFHELQGRNNLKILEIGVYGGGFTRVLHESFPEADIYCLDISYINYMFEKNNPKIHLFEMDGTKKETADFLNETFDLIIEDGSHLVEHQKASLDAFAPYLKKNGIYVTEDIVKGNDQLKRDLAAIGKKHHLKMQWIDMTSQKNRIDDIVAIFRH